ncbi:immunoglobulin domain-containing protein, partial [Pedobacter agri]|uniref:immunoglobulin domain-containing protein n=1 Tax=Pedobacter agri TaxID=454586 RepID=UPI00292E6266
MKNFYSKIKIQANLLFLAFLLLITTTTKAQTTLASGDIAFTAFDATITPVAGGVADAFSFVLLTNISSGTKISFTDQGYQGSGWQPAAATESAITWTSGTALQTGTEIYIVGLSAYTYNPANSISTANGTVALTSGTSANGLSLSTVGDQIIAFQGGNGSITGSGAYAISGINYFQTANTTTAVWNIGSANGPNASLMPPGLTGGTSAFYTGAVTGTTSPQSGKFNCSGMPVSTAGNVRTAVMNVANWSLNTSSLGQYSGCLFIASTPVITGNPPNRTLCAGGNTTFSISATGATSYQWFQNTGSGFIALTDTAPFSNVTTSTLSITGVTPTLNGTLYRCVATNAAGSATSNSATLSVINVTANGVKTDACSGSTNGTITLTPAGGIAPYTFNWGGGITTKDRTGLAPGTYSVTVTDNIGCSTTASFVIGQLATVISGTTVVTNIACNGGSNGA